MNSTALANSNLDMDLDTLCVLAKKLTENNELRKCFHLICRAMELFPDAPQPHNLLGILFEKEGNHCSAMKHFRAAYSLDPSYTPAQQNLNTYGTFYSAGKCNYGDTFSAADEAAKENPMASRCQVLSLSGGMRNENV